jgi:class 3 adenylate cyclase
MINRFKPLRWLDQLSIQSKLFLMLLLASLLAILIAGYVGYISGKSALEASRLSSLTTLRSTRAYQIESYFKGVKSNILTLGEDAFLRENFKSLRSTFQALNQKGDLPPNGVNQLQEFYTKEFIPALSRNIDGKPLADDYVPRTKAAQYLQYHYAVTNPSPLGQKEELVEAKDDSAYSKVHAQFHPFVQSMFRRYSYYDLMLIDAKTLDVIYSYEKEADFAINLKTGPYGDNNLAIGVKELLAAPERETVKFISHSNYRPSYGNPTAFILTPLYDANQIIGVIALQFATDEIDRVMTNDKQWTQSGLGETGESLLVGQDYKMRSNSRFILQDSDAYIEQMKKTGASARLLDRLKNSKTTILNQEIRLPLVDQALQGQSGVEKGKDYRQVQSIMAYAPVQFGDATWALITRMDESEVLLPIQELRKRLLITAAAVIVLTSIVATLLARLFVEPIYTIINALNQVLVGRLDTPIKVKSRDEVSELAKALNRIVGELQTQKHTIETQATNNEALLKTILPATIVPRYRAGESPIADKANNVSVIIVEIAGFNEQSMAMEVNDSVAYLNEMFSSFDVATLNQGIERIRVAGTSYMAVSGLLTPRLDHAKYAVAYALSLQNLMLQFNQTHQTEFQLRIAIQAGPVIAGVVGDTYLSYNLWGNTVIQSRVIVSHVIPGEIWVGQAVRDRLGDLYQFAPRAPIDITGRKNQIPVWAVDRA